MSIAIGFTNKYYTLWNVTKDDIYTTGVNGHHYLTGTNIKFQYIKNISFDLDKVNALYPNVGVQDDLRGKTESWVKKDNTDLCPQILKFGKYLGHNINDLIETDFDYILWMVENKKWSTNGIYAQELSKVKNHYQAIEDAATKASNDRESIFESILSDGSFEFIADSNLKIHTNMAYLRKEINGFTITFKFENGTYSENSYNGFLYGLPIINGKAKRVKGKSVKFDFVKAELTDDDYFFTVKVVNVILN